ncbi:MAG: glycosyltransferase family 2 protein [Gammaproteobacteria bacterium]|nr:glycosyltransferase family 2 protein [Gammaproteobacteria bacterium]
MDDKFAANESKLSIVIPARNESETIGAIVKRIVELHPGAAIIVVNDASTDDTASRAAEAGAHVVSHLYSKGNGAAIKTGARVATGQVIVFMDADGQHQPEDIARLLDRIDRGADMVIGARDAASQASIFRHTANWFYNLIATWITGHKVLDLTSGFRAVDAHKFREFLFMLPNGFSYPTTSTMAFFRSGYTVEYIPIRAAQRSGKSHVKVMRDGLKFLLIIFRVCTLYSPLKLFFPVALLQFLLGAGYYAFTFIESARFTNMSALLLTSAMTTLLIGLVSEQMTAILYKHDRID